MSVSDVPHGPEAHSHDHHEHGHHGHAHTAALRREPQAPTASLLRASAVARLGGVAAALIVVWAMVAWAMA